MSSSLDERTAALAPTDVPVRRPLARTFLVVGVVVLAVAVIVVQQLVRTPWGLPGHRGLFWLGTLIAVRWTVGRPGTAVGVAAASSAVILLADPTMGIHVASLLLAAFLVDRAVAVPSVRRHAWAMVLLAPAIHLVNLVNPFVHNLAGSSPLEVLSGMWFYIEGHLEWGLAAGVVGVTVGAGGHALLRRIAGPADALLA